jgi:hypothetical protein
MSETPPDPAPDSAPDSAEAAKAERRQKLIGRLVVIGLGLLIAVYLVPMFLSLGK